MNKFTSFKHHFLVATPGLDDSNFSRAVVLIQEHTQDGALGMIINKPLQIRLQRVLEHLNIDCQINKIQDHPVYMGGPVSQEQGFIIQDTPIDDFKKGYTLSADKEQLIAIALGSGPANFIVTLGYSGWKQGQLEQEIVNGDWILVPFNPKILFNTPSQNRWRETPKLLGIDIFQIPKDSGHA